MARRPHRRRTDNPWLQVARLAILTGGLVGVLWLNATHFDETEMRAIAEYAALFAAVKKFLPE